MPLISLLFCFACFLGDTSARGEVIQVPLGNFISSGSNFVWPSSSNQLVSISTHPYDPVFSTNSISVPLLSAPNDPSTYYFEAGFSFYTVDAVLSASIPGSDIPDSSIACQSSSGQLMYIGDGQTVAFHAIPDSTGYTGIGCYLSDTSSGTLTVQSITLTGSILDLAVSTPVLSQAGSTVGSDGIQIVSSGVPVQISVPISGAGFNTPETRTTTVTLKPGNQPVQTQTVSLADIQAAGGTLYIPFSAAFTNGLKTVIATIDPGDVLQESNFSNNTSRKQFRAVTASSPSISIAGTHLTQAVPDFSLNNAGTLDLVLGKKAILQVFLSATGIQPSDLRTVSIEAVVPDSSLSPLIQSVPLSAIASAPQGGYEVDFFFSPNSPGSSDLIVTVDPTQQIQTTPATITQLVETQPTRNLNIGFVAIDGCTPPATECYGSHLAQFDTSVFNMSNFIQATYPIADQGSSIGTFPGNPVFNGTVVTTTSFADFFGMNKDLLNLSIMGKLSSPPQDFVGGIVPSGYFGYHDARTSGGLTPIGYSGSLINQHSFLVEESAWTAAAHELGHSFGLPDLYSLNGTCPSESYVNGFWPSHFPPLPIPASPELMCGSEPNNPLANWIGTVSYSTIFQKLLQPADDPEVLLVAGILTSRGTFESSSLYQISKGTLSTTQPGNFVVNILGASGETISQLSEAVSFTANLNPIGRVSTDSIPIILSLPYASNADLVQLTLNSQPVATFTPSSQLLLNAVQAIADSSFVKDPARERRELLEKAQNIERTLGLCRQIDSVRNHDRDDEKDNCRFQAIRLMIELREKIDQSLTDSTTKGPTQLTRNEVLRTLDSVVLHTLPNLSVTLNDSSVEIRILPTFDRDDRGLFSVVSVTQGAHGSVHINRDGTLSYLAGSAPVQADQFTVTLQDSEGDAVVKTITIVPQPHDRDDGKNQR